MDKPAGVTSHDVVAMVRRHFRQKSVGHTGTLDPFATGLLVLVLGRATRLARFVEAERKSYVATTRFGFGTDTDDATGIALGEAWTGAWPDRATIEGALHEFVGTTVQRPPAFSAKQVGGRRSYAVAREGGALDLAPVEVTVESIEILEYAPPILRWRATVGPGTYLRAIGRDLGVRLGVGAHLTELRRDRIGTFSIDDAVGADRLTGAEPLLDPLALVAGLERIDLTEDELISVRHGRRVGVATEAERVALVSAGELIAVAEPRDGRWQPVLVLAA